MQIKQHTVDVFVGAVQNAPHNIIRCRDAKVRLRNISYFNSVPQVDRRVERILASDEVAEYAADVLDAARFPTIEFTSSELRPAAPGHYRLDGDLTIRDVTRPVALDLVVRGVIPDVWDKSRLGLTATTDIQRSDYGAGEWGHRALLSGGFMVPDTVSVTLEIEATRDMADS